MKASKNMARYRGVKILSELASFYIADCRRELAKVAERQVKNEGYKGTQAQAEAAYRAVLAFDNGLELDYPSGIAK